MNILVTKDNENVRESFSNLENNGNKVFYFPTIKMSPLKLSKIEFEMLDHLSYDYMIFTSSNAVKYFVDLLKKRNVVYDFKNSKIAVAGEKTSEICELNGIEADIIPEVYSAIGLLDYFKALKIKNKKFLIPCSKISQKVLAKGLKDLGGIVIQLPIYETILKQIPDEKLEEVENNRPEIYAFTSPSSFKNYLEIFKIKNVSNYFENTKIVAIGKTTQSKINKYGIENVLIPEKSTIENIADLIDKLIADPEDK